MSLSQKQFADFRKVCEEFNEVEEIIEEELVHEICDELIEELIEEGYSEEDATIIIEDATNDYIDEAKVTFGSDTAPMRKSGAPVGAKRRFAMRKAGEAIKGAASKAGTAAKSAVSAAKSKAAGAAVDASLAASSAKKAVSGAASSAKKAADSAAGAVKSAPGKAKAAASDAKKKAKSGIKGFIKRQAQKVVSRMSEEIEALKATGKFSEKEIEAFMEADSLAAMAARREKRLQAQRKKMGTSATGQDFGHDYGISSDERKKRQKAEFDAFVGRGKKKEK